MQLTVVVGQAALPAVAHEAAKERYTEQQQSVADSILLCVGNADVCSFQCFFSKDYWIMGFLLTSYYALYGIL